MKTLKNNKSPPTCKTDEGLLIVRSQTIKNQEYNGSRINQENHFIRKKANKIC